MRTKNSSKVIVDTCIWIEFFRTKSTISNRLRDLISSNLVAGVGIILAELLQGVKTKKEHGIITDIFDAIEYLEVTRDIWIEAGNLARKLRADGKTIPISDIIIACSAKQHRYQIFTIDKHFQMIPGTNILKTKP
jgi:hypothetical protein